MGGGFYFESSSNLIIFALETRAKNNMLITDPTTLKDFNNGILSQEELSHYLLTHFSAVALANELAEYMQEARINKPIVMSIEEFQAHFRLRGYRFQDGALIKEVEKVL